MNMQLCRASQLISGGGQWCVVGAKFKNRVEGIQGKNLCVLGAFAVQSFLNRKTKQPSEEAVSLSPSLVI